MVLIHEKISALLEQRRLKKRDLAKALGVSPQTATDICKGRSAITLPHLRNLVAFFELRAEFWLDDDRLTPETIDHAASRRTVDALARAGFLELDEPAHLLAHLRRFVQNHREAFLRACPDLSPAERRFLGLPEVARGPIGQTAGGGPAG
ncbi:MAG: helix-turn-helix domain-containing protein [Planctomycetes bacterium]|nr:helix-turn-helix domain-containing protein [Planctomycetota bacterium]